jgi:hypothetical protein
MTSAPATPTRRRFLRWSALGLGALALGLAAGLSVPAWRSKLLWTLARLRELPLGPEGRIARHFPYLDLDPAGLSAFVAEWERQQGPLRRSRALPPQIYTRFLLSSDFFQNGASEQRTVKYVAFYDPYRSVCSNPLARFD